MRNIEFRWCDQPITGYIYFFESQANGPIKIGYTTDINKRLLNIQTACPYKLKLRVAIPGNIECEKAIHKHYSFCRTHGEWFNPTPQINEIISQAIELDSKYNFLGDDLDNAIHDKNGLSLSELYGERNFGVFNNNDDLEIKEKRRKSKELRKKLAMSKELQERIDKAKNLDEQNMILILTAPPNKKTDIHLYLKNIHESTIEKTA